MTGNRERLWQDLADLFAQVHGSGTDIAGSLEVTFAEARRRMRLCIGRPRQPGPRPPIEGLAELVETIAREHQVSVESVMGPSTCKAPTAARVEVWCVLRARMPAVPAADIAAAFERRGHSTVVTLCRRHLEAGGAAMRARVAWRAGQVVAGRRAA